MTDLGIALAGYGYWGPNLGRNIASARGARLVGIVDPRPDARERAFREHPSAAVWSSFDRVLDNPAVQAVVLATPTATHHRLALDALDAGRHVLIEKPFAASTAAAEAVADLADASGRVVMIGHTYLYAEPIQSLREQIACGEVAAITRMSSQRFNIKPARDGTSVIWNLAPHDISIVMHLLGARPVAVSALAPRFDGVRTVSECQVELTFENGTIAIVSLSCVARAKQRRFRVFSGRAGVIDLELDHSRAHWREPLQVEIEDFVRACTTGEPPLSNARDGVEVVRVLEAIDASVRREGEPVRLGVVPSPSAKPSSKTSKTGS